MRISRPPKLPQRGAGDEALRPRRQTSEHKRVRAARPDSARLSLLDPTLPHPQGCFPSSRAAHVTPFVSYPSSPCSSRKPAASARGFSISNSLSLTFGPPWAPLSTMRSEFRSEQASPWLTSCQPLTTGSVTNPTRPPALPGYFSSTFSRKPNVFQVTAVPLTWNVSPLPPAPGPQLITLTLASPSGVMLVTILKET